MKRLNPVKLYDPQMFGFVHATANERIMFTTGQTGRDSSGNIVSDSFGEQARQALLNIKNIIEAAGRTMDDVMKVTAYVTDCRYGEEYMNIFNEYFRSGFRPASTMVGVTSLWNQRQLIEIEVVVDMSRK